jgi:hypothetical protein
MVVIVRSAMMETQNDWVQGGRRCIGLDVHREFAQVAIWQGGLVIQADRFATTPEGVRAFAQGLGQRQDPPSPAQPRRRPRREQCALHHGAQPAALR